MEGKKIAVVSPSLLSAVNETFIRAHVENIPSAIFYYGGKIPYFCETEKNKDFSKPNLIQKIKIKLGITTLESIHLQNVLQSFKKNNVKTVLAEYGDTGSAICGFCKDNNIKLFVHFHGYDASVYKVLEENRISYPKMFEYATKVFVVSNVMHAKLLSLGCPQEKLILNPYGPNNRFLEYVNKPVKHVFVAVASFKDKKAPYYTLLAFKKAFEKHQNIRLVWGGDGFLLPSIKNLATHFGLNNSIEFLGFLNPEEVFNSMKDKYCFLQHSIVADNGDMEGAPVAIIEAQAMGIPVIATRHAGIPDVVVENETGILVEEHDVDGMAEAIIDIIENHKMAEIFGSNAKIRIKNNFSIKEHIDTITQEMI